MVIRQSEGGPKVSVSFNLFHLKKQLEMSMGKELSWAQIAREANLHRNTVHRIAHNSTERVDLSTLAALLSFFHARGMKISLDDLVNLKIEETASSGGG